MQAAKLNTLRVSENEVREVFGPKKVKYRNIDPVT
jgi:hypothetical protein